MIDLKELNDRQKEAVLADDKHIIVLAGAGSGKTKVLTTRIAYLISNGTPVENILALTFTNKASIEMKERISKATGISKYKINAMTFHSFAVSVLRKHLEVLNLGYTKNFKIYDEDDVKKIMFKILEEKNIDTKEYKAYVNARKIYNFFGELPQNVDLSVILSFNEIAIKENSLTFDDLILFLCKAFSVSSILKEYQEQFKYVLADEFQDTDIVQYNILKMLTAIHENLFVVGDDYQAIYSWRGANPKIVFKFLEDFPDYKMIKLEQNYRSTPEILNLANHIIKNNKHQIEKTMFTENASGLTPTLFKMEYYNEEPVRIVSLIKQLNKRGFKYKDMAILYRVNALSRTFEEEMIKNNVPYIIYNGTSFYKREEIKDLLFYLRLVADENDNVAFKRVVNKPRRKVGEKLLEQIEQSAMDNQGFNYSLLSESEKFNQTKKFFEQIMIAKSKYINCDFTTITNIIDYVLKDMNYVDYLITLKTDSTNDREKNIEELKNIVVEFEKSNNESDYETREDYLNFFLQSVSLYANTNTDDNGEEKDAVKLMTVHSSKGLEFPIVFLPALEEDIFPSNKALGNDEMEEERRLFYVGITRAKKFLFLSTVNKRWLNNHFNYEIPSRFINESHNKIKIKEFSGSC